MPLGDSLTQASPDHDPTRYSAGTHGGYRKPLWDRFAAEGFLLDFAGSQSDGPVDFDTDHEGHPGWSVGDLVANVDLWLSNEEPTIVLLLIGTNDAFRSTVENSLEQLKELIGTIDAQLLPGGVLLVGTVPRVGAMFKVQNEWIVEYNAGVAELVNASTMAGGQVELVDLFDLISEDDLFTDGVHWNRQGFAKVADAWYKSLFPIILERASNETGDTEP
jgi:lysophospholipase L1-like esterase